MEKEFVNYEIALALKELGFDEPCFGYYFNKSKVLMVISEKDINYLTGTSGTSNTTFTLAPTFSQAFRFFREKYGLISYVHPLALLQDTKKWCYEITNFESSWDEDSDLHTPEEAELACLQKLIEIVKNK
jgi:hypothetical protein